MLYQNILLEALLLSACSSIGLATPLEIRADGLVPTNEILEKAAAKKPLNWQDKTGKNGVKFRAVTIPGADWEAAKAAAGGHRRRSDVSIEASLEPRQSEIKGLKTKCYNSGSWALDTALTPLIASICDAGSFNWFLDKGSKQVLHFLGLENEHKDQMGVFVTLGNLVDGIYSGLDETACVTMAETLILQSCQGKNGDTKGGVITAQNLSGVDSITLAVDPTTNNCNC
ncbi:MAG: hypothetical protein M1830_003595 [Pleopsidium flavum]|nr:MAG: hypothetical protein M1830_003595 [Pleopsidium flavum]